MSPTGPRNAIQFRTAYLRVPTKRDKSSDRLRKQCTHLVSNKTLQHAFFSTTKQKVAHLYIQSKDKDISATKCFHWFGCDVEIVDHGKHNKADSKKICSGFVKDSTGKWLSNPDAGPCEEFSGRFPPNIFECPLCNETMKDAVVAQSGNSYCKLCIERQFKKKRLVNNKWLAKGAYDVITMIAARALTIFLCADPISGTYVEIGLVPCFTLRKAIIKAKKCLC